MELQTIFPFSSYQLSIFLVNRGNSPEMQEQRRAKAKWNCKLFSSYQLPIFLVNHGSSSEMQEKRGSKEECNCKPFFSFLLILHILHIQRQGRFQHITLFSTQSFMRTTSIIRRQKASEYKMAKRRYRQLNYPGTLTFSTFERRDMAICRQ